MPLSYHSGSVSARGITTLGVYGFIGAPNVPGMNRIKELREDKGWTQVQLADAAGTSDATVQRIETGKRRLTQKWITKFSVALECHAAEILEKLPPAAEGLPVLGKGAGRTLEGNRR